ncbi:AAA family ATPase [Clostridium tagluense]|uniref:AAA family ATPase n=1 Tax=Clostridium tagluense TaxID=360422 RepID=UPI001C6EADAA|nr:AAA family ATPase [Clostridium tagluense]MBW9158725.1 AAA family ATPase [Clostridium tagluense]WLC67402.1 AAA family ATPase [Clostridium tagluense]
MSYKIESLKIRNFKCFDNKKFYEFYFIQDANPTILSGPNGFGKTTFFDAIELIFTKKITRLNAEIEDGRTNLGKNILLNTSDECGYLILTLINTRYEKLTIISQIDNSLTKLTVESSIKFTCIEGTMESTSFDQFINNTVNWKSDITEFENLRYIKEHFNIYYYVSQAESVHFLKNTISNRKDSMTKLLQTEMIQGKIDIIEKDLIGVTKAKKGVVVNEEITATKNQLDSKISNLKRKLEDASGEYEVINYAPLLVYPQNTEKKKWDIENLDLQIITEKQLAEYFVDINGISKLYQDLADYKKYLKNKEILIFSNSNESISNYIKFYGFIKDNKFDSQQVEDEIIKLNRTLDVYKYSAFFRKELEIINYKKDDVLQLQQMGMVPESLNISEVDCLVNEIKALNSQLGDNQKKINELIQAREKLYSINEVKDNNAKSSNCPYCNYLYDNPELLEEAYSTLSTKLKSSQNGISIEIKNKKIKLASFIKPTVDLVVGLLGQGYVDKINQIRLLASEYSMLLKSEKKMADILKIGEFIIEVNSWKELDEENRVIELKRIIESNLTGYTNEMFLDNLKLYDYGKIYNENSVLLSIEQSNLNDKDCIDNKIRFIKYQNSLIKNKEIDLIKSEVKMLIMKLKKLEKIRKQLDELKNLYNEAIDEYKNLVLKKLRVPLLIYTGKVLQDYQNGLGVFINQDEMRFVSNGDAKHDILNTFSSGQLSGFVLSFLFAMNKRYISEENDDIGFILIDDPVQTMDDINIASFIEVLRNDFPKKQIILSTHETDKENYILYKFLKYNLKGQSFNVKDNMY